MAGSSLFLPPWDACGFCMLPNCPLQLSTDGEPFLPRAFCLGFYSLLKSLRLKTLPSNS